METGRSHPGRSLILKLAGTLKMPMRQQNALLAAAGYVAEYREESLTSPKMKTIREALERILNTGAHSRPKKR